MRLFNPNDWKVVWADSAVWNCSNYDDKWTENCFYTIEYSESRNKYRLKTSGYRPEDHRIYSEALKTLAQFNTKEK